MPSRYLRAFGLSIGYFDYSRQASPVSPIPAPERNLWNALVTVGTDPENAIALNTISRMSEIVISAGSRNLPEMKALFDKILAVMLSTKNSIVFSRLSTLIYPIEVGVVRQSLDTECSSTF